MSGAPPSPPDDLDTRSLPCHDVERGERLYRIHRSGFGARYFGKDRDPAQRQRWDAPDGSYGVCYLAFEGQIAFVETLLRDVRARSLSMADLDARSISVVEAIAPLQLVQMCDEHMHTLGADASVVQGSYSGTWQWSRALYQHPQTVDGIRYRARHDDSGFAVALFDRAKGKVAVTQPAGLNDPLLRAQLGDWLDRYQVALID